MGDAQVPGLGWGSLALSFVSLGAVCLLAWGALRVLAGRGIGRASGRVVRVVARCTLEPRRAVYVIEVAGRCFLVGVGDGPMSLLAELDGARIPATAAAVASGAGFSDVLARVLGKPEAGASSPREGS